MYGGYVLLWPFDTPAQARAWQLAYRQGGHQPWHLDAGLTAQSFTQGYLGLTEIDRVVTVRTDADGAHVAVGYRNPAGRPATSAVVHLIRLGGPGADRPWEVVGTDDTTLTLDVPAYGATVTSPVTVGGTITGVDEHIAAALRQTGFERPLGTAQGVPAGGERQPWSTTLAFSGARPGAATVSAWTGGHVQGVERFAVTGVLIG